MSDARYFAEAARQGQATKREAEAKAAAEKPKPKPAHGWRGMGRS